MVGVVWKVIQSLIGLLCFFLRPLKRLWCRRIQAAEMDPGVPTIVTQSTAIDMTQNSSQADAEMEPWDAWDNNQSQAGSLPYSQSNAAYYQSAGRHGNIPAQLPNQQMRGRKPESESEPEPDYFMDMTPEVKRPAKILVKKKDSGSGNNAAFSTRLSAMEVAPPLGSELESWEEGQGAWGAEIAEDLSWEAEAAMKEKRRLERQNRTLEQQKKKQQRDAQRGLKKDTQLAVKIS